MPTYTLTDAMHDRIAELKARIGRWQDEMFQTSDQLTRGCYTEAIRAAELEIHDIETFLAS